MNIRIRRLILDPIGLHYDKILIVVALALLLVTALTLYFRSTVKSEELRRARAEEEALRPKNADVAAVAKNPFAKDRAELAKPRQLAASGSNDTLFVPEARVSCMNDKCRKPILFASEKCPYCGWVRNPVEPDPQGVVTNRKQGDSHVPPKRDSDGGGLLDWYEKKHDLNIIDASDDSIDSDGDGYTNLEEFKAGEELKSEFSPVSKASVPPAWWGGKLVVTDAKALEFKLRYMSSMRTEGSNWLHVINEVGGQVQTHSKKIGEVINGFTVIKHEVKSMWVVPEGTTSKVKKDVSELTLESSGGVKVVLVKGEPKLQWERTADIYYIPARRRITVKEGEEFQIGAYKYRVKDIDASSKKVLISDSAFTKKEDREVWLAPASADVVVEAAVAPVVRAPDRPAAGGSLKKPAVDKVDKPAIEAFEKR